MNINRAVLVVGSITTLALGALIGVILYPKDTDPGTVLRLCDVNDRQPPLAFETTLVGNIDFRNIQAQTVEMAADVSYPTGNPATAKAPPTVVNPQTRLDLNLNLDQTTRNSAMVTIKIQDSTIKFNKGGNLAITSFDGNKRMFCLKEVSDNSASFYVRYFNGNGQKPNQASININVIVPDSQNPGIYSMPLALDPEIRNHG